jgi:phage shock protein E
MSLLNWLFGGGAAARIDGARARQLVHEGALLVDVRTEGEFATGHVDGALNVPVQRIERLADTASRERPIVVYCRSGARSASAATALQRLGFAEVHDLGSIANW